MKKKITYLFVLFCFMVIVSCKDTLDVSPQNILSDSQVFSDKSTVHAFLTSLYNSLPIEDYGAGGYTAYNLANRTDQSMTDLLDQGKINLTGDGTGLGDWDYGSVRHVNQFIKAVKKTSSFGEVQKKQWLGEALFIRAYDYFSMVKRYGGVPLIRKVQNYTGNNLSELQVPRNKEKMIYDFIATQLDSAAQLMSPTSPEKGRTNKYVALALKSRAMLFAASAAAFAPVQLNGLLGIPSEDTNEYWKQAYNAAKQIINSGKYSLYNKFPNDKSKNFEQLFLDSSNNPEIIFAKYYKYPEEGHSFDLWYLPYGVRSATGYGSRIGPTLQWVEKYEYKDGSQGDLKLEDSQGNYIKYKNPLNLFKNKDPRLAATVLLPFSKWRETLIDVRAGIIDNGKTITAGNYSKIYKGMHVIAINGIGGGGGEISLTGFYIRKHLNPNYSSSEVNGGSGNTSTQPWIDFRLGGILLNYAEAAVELGKKSEAKQAINKIRNRAGLAPVNNITLEEVRHERTVELAFEHQRYWDLVRWRTADKVLDHFIPQALYPYYVEGDDNSYIFKAKKLNYQKTFRPKQYYQRIPPDEIDKDPKLKQNPGYQ